MFSQWGLVGTGNKSRDAPQGRRRINFGASAAIFFLGGGESLRVVCVECISTVQVGVSLAAPLDSLFKQSALRSLRDRDMILGGSPLHTTLTGPGGTHTGEPTLGASTPHTTLTRPGCTHTRGSTLGAGTPHTTLTRPGCTHTGGPTLGSSTPHTTLTRPVHAHQGIYIGCKHTTYHSNTPRHTWGSSVCTQNSTQHTWGLI